MRSIQSGSIIDERYRVTAYLGAGGMGTVYAVRELELDREIAVKLLNTHQSEDTDSAARFKREAQVLSQIDQQNIVKVYRYGFWQEMPFIAMEKLDGRSLQAVLNDDGALAPRHALEIAKQIAEGLSAIHAKNIVHRDLKPSNLFICNDNVVKLLDFGLCKILPGDSSEVQRLTQSGYLIGSVQYMSPEMCMGKPAETRSDIYSLGIILVEMLTGAQPFGSDSSIGVLYKHINDPIPLLKDRFPDFPQIEEIDSLLQRCLAKEPADRFADSAQVLSELTRLLEQIPESSAPLMVQGKNREVRKVPLAIFLLPGSLLVILLVLWNPWIQACLVCAPAAFESYKDGLKFEINLAETTAKQGYLYGLSNAIWHVVEKRARTANDLLMQSYALSKQASSGAGAGADERLVDPSSAQESLEILATALKNGEKDRTSYSVMKEIIKSDCLTLTRAKYSDSKLHPLSIRLNTLLSKNYGASISHSLLLPLYQLRLDRCSKEERGWVLRVLGDTAYDSANFGKALILYKQAVNALDATKDVRTAIFTQCANCCRYLHVPGKDRYLQDGLQYCSEARKAIGLIEDPGASESAMGNLSFTEGFLYALTLNREKAEDDRKWLIDHEADIQRAALASQLGDQQVLWLKGRSAELTAELTLEETSRNSLRELNDYLSLPSSLCLNWAGSKGWLVKLNSKRLPKQFGEYFQILHSGHALVPESKLALLCTDIFQLGKPKEGIVELKLRKPVVTYLDPFSLLNALIAGGAPGNSAACARAFLANVSQADGITKLLREGTYFHPDPKIESTKFSLNGLPLSTGRPIYLKNPNDCQALASGAYLLNSSLSLPEEPVNWLESHFLNMAKNHTILVVVIKNSGGPFLFDPCADNNRVAFLKNCPQLVEHGLTLLPLLAKNGTLVQVHG